MKKSIEIEKYNAVVSEFAAYKIEATQRLELLQFQLSELQRLVFGAKSERYVPDIPAEQLSLFEQERQAIIEQHSQVNAHERKKTVEKKKPARLKLPTHLRVEEEVLEPDMDTSNMVRIGERETRTLAYTPADLFVKLLTRPIYAQRPNSPNEATDPTVDINTNDVQYKDPANSDKSPIYVAPMPSRFIDKCMADVSLLVAIIVDKYVDHLPLFRTRKRLKRLAGMDIPASTISGWIGQSATNLTVLYNKLMEIVLACPYLQVDETRMEVLPEKGEGRKEEEATKGTNKAPPKSAKRKTRGNKKRKTHRGYQWGYLSPNKKLVFFEYNKTRSAANPLLRLKTYVGTIQTDCYEVYDQIRKAYAPRIVHFHCLNHSRRNFEKALSNDAKRADHALQEFQRLYAIEKVAKDENWSTDKIYQVRQQKAKPILEALFDWMEEEYYKVLPSSSIGLAMSYMMKRKKRMMHYLSDGNLQIDNNLVENDMRPIAVGRRNYLFAGSHQAAQWAAMFYSFFACCRMHGVNPNEWLSDVMRRLPEHPVNQIEQLLPHLWKIEQENKNKSVAPNS